PQIRSALAGLAWPGLPAHQGTRLLAILYQLELSQWWTPRQLRRHQFRQLVPLLQHAFQHVPYYRAQREAWGIDAKWNLTPESFAARVPILTRAEVQEGGAAFHSEDVPEAHGKIGDTFTSGSTGRPLKTLKSGLSEMMWQAFTLRENLWHRDLQKKLAVIKIIDGAHGDYPAGAEYNNWGKFASQTFETGSSHMLHVSTKTHEQVEWLERVAPDYILTLPANAQALAHYCLENGIKFPNLKQIATFSDLLRPEARAACEKAWGVPVVDIYSSAEIGYIAMQCPDSANYHLQAESAYVEILSDAGRPCEPGEVGRVIATPLHNFAMPLLRYHSGDLAEAGECDCGRGLPAIRRIMGRTRSTVILPGGEQHYPSLQDLLINFAMVRQFQIRRRERDALDIKLVVTRPLTESEEAAFRTEMHERFKHPFRVNISYHDELARSKTGKFHDFKDEYGNGGGNGG
ncbi:MAG: phenylacetate--CoA ligase family protein, partial [Rhodospirillaceae bacterium]|nr:phenylacetate--CoA ligase family protein [Rhodospirillaceae bacterium]